MTETTPPTIMPGAEPFFRRGEGDHADIGVLCLHGLTATPHEVRWLAEHLNKQGYTVLAPRIAGHGTHYHDLERVTWGDWYTSALDAYQVLAQQCEQVFIAGLSMGGLLACLLAQAVPIAGIAVMASPLVMRSRLLPYAHQIKRLQPYQDFADNSDFPRYLREEQLRLGEPNYGRVRYDICPTHALAELYALCNVVRESLPGINVPTCLIYSKNDKTVPFENFSIAVNGLKNAPILQQHILEKSGHIATMDIERETVFGHINTFIGAPVNEDQTSPTPSEITN
ncbi:MAG: alpha/beta fold hydrolase [Aggregatilineales bacterium]